MNQTKTLGKIFGYPPCCVAEFEAIINKAESPSAARSKAGNNTGFIPCAKHADQINSGTITLEGLIVNRLIKTKFPNVKNKEVNDALSSLSIKEVEKSIEAAENSEDIPMPRTKLYWFSFSGEYGANLGVCCTEGKTSMHAYYKASFVYGIVPKDYSDMLVMEIKTLDKDPIEVNKFYTAKEMHDLGYKLHTDKPTLI